MLAAAETPVSAKVQEYADKNLSYVGDAKLTKLSDAELRALWKLIAAKTDAQVEDAKLDAMDSKALVEGILAMKKRGLVATTAAAAAAAAPLPNLGCLAMGTFGVDAPPRPDTPSPPPPSPQPSETSREKEAQAVATAVQAIVDMHSIAICSWNAQELWLGDPDDPDEAKAQKATQKRQHWFSLLSRFTRYDVIFMQEVPAGEVKHGKRTNEIGEWLQSFDEDAKWKLYFSEPSGKDGKTTGSRVHVHACWVKEPVELKVCNTLTKVGNLTMDYAPLQVFLHDPRFADPNDRDFVVTSVHLPPDTTKHDRRGARDAQLSRLLSQYSAPDTTEYRLGKPFGPNKIAPNAPMHIICGDFNVFPGAMTEPNKRDKTQSDTPFEPEEAYGLTKHGFVAKLPEGAATSEGRNHYDNFLVDAVANERFLISESILPLNRKEVKISDHDPIIVTIEEMRETKQAVKSKGRTPTSGSLTAPVPKPASARKAQPSPARL